MLFTDSDQLRSVQLNDPDIGKLFSALEDGESESSEEDLLYSVLDGLLYHKDPKSSCPLHPMKLFKLYAP